MQNRNQINRGNQRHDQYSQQDWDERFNAGILDKQPTFNTSYEAVYGSHTGTPDGKDYLRDSRENHPGRTDNYYAGRGPRNFKRSDERIKDEVCEMLTHHPEVDAEAVDVEVKDGEVTLSGTVPSRHMKHMAEDCTERCMGVKDIHNNIRVKKDDKSSLDVSSERSTFLV